MTGTLFSILKEAGSHNRDTITNDRDTIKSYRKTISNPEFSSPRTNFELSKNTFIRMAKAIFGALVQNSDTVPVSNCRANLSVLKIGHKIPQLGPKRFEMGNKGLQISGNSEIFLVNYNYSYIRKSSKISS